MGGISTFEREFGAIFKMPADVNERLRRFGGKRGVRSVENAECGKCGVWKMRSVENAECGKCGVWKMRSVENE